MLVILPLLALLVIGLSRLATALYAASRTFHPKDVPPGRVAIVFGAGLLRSGGPTTVLRDRVKTAADLYFAGKVDKLLLSGDNSEIYYNEPGAMHDYAVKLGVPEKDIVLDFAGRRTYDTCYRARQIFGLREAILVTQSFHLPRALYTCNSLGVSAVGVAADLHNYLKRSWIYWNLREIPATLVAFWEVNLSRPEPILGKPEPIYQHESQF
jgi:SanA protein